MRFWIETPSLAPVLLLHTSSGDLLRDAAADAEVSALVDLALMAVAGGTCELVARPVRHGVEHLLKRLVAEPEPLPKKPVGKLALRELGKAERAKLPQPAPPRKRPSMPREAVISARQKEVILARRQARGRARP